MFVDFFYTLRKYKLPVSITEWMVLMDALSRGYAWSDLTDFYFLARSVLVKSESYFDQYDLAFREFFQSIETPPEIRDEVLEWLRNPLNRLPLTPEELAEMDLMDIDELLRLFEQRLREQSEAHHGGNKWIGTGGTSPFGHSGYHPGGMRVGGESRNRSAVKVAAERRFKNLRSDVTLDVRQIKVALKRLRQLSRIGDKDELDVDETVDKTCKNAGDIELVWTRGRKNNVKVLLFLDVGGSMNPHSAVCSRLFSAAHSATHFRDFQHYYFHNCIYEKLYTDAERDEFVYTNHLLRTLPGDYKVILVGDAQMAYSELTYPHGALYYQDLNETAGIEWLKRICDHFTYAVWLNPEPFNWNHPTISAIKHLFPMYELTLDGLDHAIQKLIVKH
ncbi:MAG: VWA domain-containing protein [Deltaproteobacteria bacterium]|nr:VWA domain-containing protein [Deltaproteobacteria bacterium]